MTQTPEEKKAAKHKYYEDHREESRERSQKWYKLHHADEKVKIARRKANRKWREAHPEEVKARSRKQYELHAKEMVANARRWSKANPEKAKATIRKWHETHVKEVKAATYKRKYGITTEDYECLLAQQNGVCAVCGGNRSKHALCVDHNHTTKKVRGLLCKRCNLALGHMKDNPEWIQNLANYAAQS